MRDVITIAHLTVSEARRRRLVLAALLAVLAFIAVFALGLFFAYRDMLQNSRATFVERQAILTSLTLVALFAANFLSVVFAVLLPVDTLSGEIESGVIQTLASKPIRRADIIVGKWIGHLVIAVTYLVLIVAGILLSVRLIADFAPADVGRALPLMMLEIAVMLTIAIAGGTRFSTVTTGVIALGFYSVAFVGGLMEQIAGLAGIASARTIGVIASLISPADAMWRLASYYMQPELLRTLAGPLFAATSVPTPLMVWWAAGYLLATLALAVRTFNRRAL